jgi:hypothetical protein
MKKIGDYDLFFDFFMFQSKPWVGVKKKSPVPGVVAIFRLVIFLNIGKNRNTLAIKVAEKKGRLLTNFRFFFAFCLIMEKSKLLIPSSARYAWGIFYTKNNYFRQKLTILVKKNK